MDRRDETVVAMSQAQGYEHEDVQTFLNSYGVALSAGDLDTIAESYAFPALVVADEVSVLVADPDTVRESFRGAAQNYRQRGLVGAVAQIEDVRVTSAGLVWVDVRWSYRDEYAREADAESFRYLLRRGRNTFTICVVVPVDPDVRDE